MEDSKYQDQFCKILNERTPLLDGQRLKVFVEKFLEKGSKYLEIYNQNGSPLYLIDQEALTRKVKEFYRVFSQRFSAVRFFYALKSNSHPFLIETVVANGYGVDVSSGRELKSALLHNPERIIFSGPGKTVDELDLACQHADRVTVLLDNFSELRRLEQVAAQRGVHIRAGVRLMIEEKGLWRKFGIPLDQVINFFEEAAKYSHVELCGLQFHCSWNLNANKQTAFLARLEEVLSQADRGTLSRISFIDIGGGYWPVQGEWMQPVATPEGHLRQCLESQYIGNMEHYCLPALPIEQFSDDIAQALKRHIFPYVQCEIYMEPGRWISHESMHILLQVIDKKSDDVVIVDGGINMVGWERYEMDYFPVINLSQPALSEKPCVIFGSLCTPHDLWGYSYFGKGIAEGDVLLVPTQGAYTYSLRQEFIKPLPDQVVLTREGFHKYVLKSPVS